MASAYKSLSKHTNGTKATDPAEKPKKPPKSPHPLLARRDLQVNPPIRPYTLPMIANTKYQDTDTS